MAWACIRRNAAASPFSARTRATVLRASCSHCHSQTTFLARSSARLSYRWLCERVLVLFYSRKVLLLTYGQNFAWSNARAMDYVDKILGGAKPGDLPVEQATKLELVITSNRKGARPHRAAPTDRPCRRGHRVRDSVDAVAASVQVSKWHRADQHLHCSNSVSCAP